MLKSNISNHKLFRPFAYLLGLTGAVSSICYQLSLLIQIPESPYNIDIFTLNQTFSLLSIALFVALIVLLRNTPFKTIFHTTLAFSAVAMIMSVYVFHSSLTTYFFAAFFCPKAITLIGWAYINQLTNKNEGIKYYFALTLVASLIAGLFSYSPIAANHFLTQYYSQAPNMYPSLLLWTGIASLGLIWLCDRGIHKRVHDNESAENVAITPNQWVSAIGLGILVCGLQLVQSINGPEFKSSLKQLLGLDFAAFMAQYAFGLGLATLGLAVISVVYGPKLIEKFGWKSTILVAPVIAGIALVCNTMQVNAPTLVARQAIPIVFSYFWIIPLIQIAFLNYAKKNRFSLQAWTFLVVAALLRFAVEFNKFDQNTALIASYVILSLMIGSAILITKPK